MVLAFVVFIGVATFVVMLFTAIYTEGAIAEIESKDDKW